MTRRVIVAANWKMNGDLALVDSMLLGLKDLESSNVEVIICPSFPYLSELNQKIKAANLNEIIHVGAQTVSKFFDGAHTGEVSTNMLNDLSIKYVIVGHSERRSVYNETSEQVASKVHAVLKAGLSPILCIGETEEERSSGKIESVLMSQIQPVIDEIGIKNFSDVIISYEPVWAIGTGNPASSAMAQETHYFIRQLIAKQCDQVAANISLLYGGSVNAANCEELFAQPDIDGGLIGGASLQAEQFKIICSAAKGK
ncbi:triose-phosphate isomerase [Colwellia sp. E2M01]|uniref:triose-phosphate isomerase n=1 Tax=Colwellia sp. E2M01 TaxID=2841561 RepID=UPI001C08BD3B|nr:triose-phosphate isomerase [Colwellia sp. E2M01]MBU2871760.1 triose-phosphate isomerase [Colwellia sp. E2M01]